MSVNIEIGKGADGCQDFIKVGAVALLSCDSFIIRGKSRILMLYDMGGADDKVKIIGSCVVGNFFEVIWLEIKEAREKKKLQKLREKQNKM